MSVVGGFGGAFRCTASIASSSHGLGRAASGLSLASLTSLRSVSIPFCLPFFDPAVPFLSWDLVRCTFLLRISSNCIPFASIASVVSEACRFCTVFGMPKQFTARFSRDRSDCKVSPCRLRRSSANRNDHARTVLLTGLNIQCRAGRFGECDVNTL